MLESERSTANARETERHRCVADIISDVLVEGDRTNKMNPLIVPNDQITEHPINLVLCSALLGNMCTTIELVLQ